MLMALSEARCLRTDEDQKCNNCYKLVIYLAKAIWNIPPPKP